MQYPAIKVLDHGHIKVIEAWGRGESGEMESAIIEAARQSTQGNFQGWEFFVCKECGLKQEYIGKHLLSDDVWCSNPGLSKDGYKEGGDKKLLAYLYNNKHSTPFEFCGMTIEVNAPIIVFREWHRHRTQSYNEMSARYTALPDVNYVPTMERLFKTQNNNKQAQAISGAAQLTEENAEGWLENLEEFYVQAEALYQHGLAMGIPKELARLVIPVGRYSQMRASANLRNWLAFLTLRMDPLAQDEIRQYATILGRQIIAQVFPRTWSLFEGTLKY